MGKICNLIKDALTICCTSANEQFWHDLAKIEIGDGVDFYDFYLRRIEGKYYDNVFQICYYEPELGKDVVWGELKFGLGKDEVANHDKRSGARYIWVSIANRTLYTEKKSVLVKGQYIADNVVYMDYIFQILGLEFYHVTSMDLALDTDFDMARKIKAAIRNKHYTTYLNGKRIDNRQEDRPEIISVYTGNLNRDKYLTLCVKQRKAIHNKNKGLVLTAYNKSEEIMTSGKDYINEFYGNPAKFYRLEVHFNSDDVKDYLIKAGIEATPDFLFNKEILLEMFDDAIGRMLRFDDEQGNRLGWVDILFGQRDITTTPTKCATQSKKQHYSTV